MRRKPFKPGYNQQFLATEDGAALKKEMSVVSALDMDDFENGAQQYLEECSYSIKLGKLYMMGRSDQAKVETGTCAYNQNMEYTPIQLELHPNIKDLYENNNYLLQVWNKNGKKVFQMQLKQMVQSWAICFNYFIFRLGKEDQQNKDHFGDYFWIYDISTAQEGFKNQAITCVNTNWLGTLEESESFKYLAYNNNKFFVANKDEIRVVNLRLNKMSGIDFKIVRQFTKDQAGVIKLKPPSSMMNENEIDSKNHYKIHGLALINEGIKSPTNNKEFVLVYVEVPETNLISVNELIIDDGCLPPFEFKYKMVEWREYSQRDKSYEYRNNDPIEKYQAVFDKTGRHSAVALRESKAIDIYSDGYLLDTPINPRNNSNVQLKRFFDFQMTYEHTFFFMQGPKSSKISKRMLKHGLDFSNHVRLQDDEKESMFFTERIKDNVKLFSGLLVIHTNVFIAHGKNIAQFYLKNREFELRTDCKQEFRFKHIIKFIFKRMITNPVTKEPFYHVGVCLENGEIHVIASDTPANYLSWKIKKDESGKSKIEGEIMSYAPDPVQYRCNLFLSKVIPQSKEDEIGDIISQSDMSARRTTITDDLDVLKKAKKAANNEAPLDLDLVKTKKKDKSQIKVFIYYNKIYDITANLEAAGVDKMRENDQIIGMFEDANMLSHFIYYQKDIGRCWLFCCAFLDDGEKIKKKGKGRGRGRGEGQGNNFNSQASSIWQWIGQQTSDRLNEISRIEITFIDRFIFKPNDVISKLYDRETTQNQKVWLDTDPQYLEIKQAVVTAEHLILFSNINGYKYTKNKGGKFGQRSVELIPEIQWRNSFISNMRHVYMINETKEDEKTRNSGLSYFNLKRFFDPSTELGPKYQNNTTYLQFAQIGVQTMIDYTTSIERLAYIKDYSEIMIIPTLHLNSVTLIGQPDFNEFLAVKEQQDAFYGLINKKNQQDINVSFIMTWDKITGKLMETTELLEETNNFTGYQRFVGNNVDMYRSGLYDQTLLVSYQPIEQDDSILTQYYDSHSLEEKFQGQVVYVKSDNNQKEFHKFQLIEIQDQASVRVLFQFIHPKYKGKQLLYFNKRCDQMIEWLEHDIVKLYSLQDIGKENGVRQIKCLQVKRLLHLNQRFGREQFLDHVSPDFKCFIDLDLSNHRFIIRDLPSEEQKLLINGIPKFLMPFDDNPAEAILRIKWVNDQSLKILSKDGMVKIIDIETALTQQAFNQTINFDYDKEKGRNFHFDRRPLPVEDIIERLIRKTQVYKDRQMMNHIEFRGEELQMYDHMFAIDFNTSIERKKYMTDLSFSFITWRTLEQLKQGDMKIQNIDEETALQLVFTILPGGKTFLHMLFLKMNYLEVLLQITKSAKLCFPYLRDMNGQCMMDMAIKNDQIKTANMLLKYLADQTIDHHSRMIGMHLPKLLELDLSNFNMYMESRSLQTEQTKQYTRQEINEQSKTPGITYSDFWATKQWFDSQLFTNNFKGEEIQVYFMDCTLIHEFTKEGGEFFRQMSITENLQLFDIENIRKLILFKWPIVQSHIFRYLFIPFLIQLVTMVIFTSYQLPKIVNNEPRNSILDFFVLLIMASLSIYNIILESQQIRDDPVGYLKDFWNYIDSIPPVIIIITVTLFFQGRFKEFNGDAGNWYFGMTNRDALSIPLSIATVLLWIRLLYFLRIFDSFNFLIRAISEVVYEMIVFLTILIIIMAAFGDCFKVINNANTPENQFIDGGFISSVFYVYLIGLGEFGLDDFGSVGVTFLKVLFFINTMLTTIVTMNLFIAIISASFEKISSQATQAAYREKAGLIAENDFLLNLDEKLNWIMEGKYLVYVNRVGMAEGEDTTEFRIKQIIEEFTGKIGNMVNNMQKENVSVMKKNDQELREYIEGQMTKVQVKENVEESKVDLKRKKAKFDSVKPLKQVFLELEKNVEVYCSEGKNEQKAKTKIGSAAKAIASIGANKATKYLSEENETKILNNAETVHDKWCVNTYAEKKPWVIYQLKSKLTIRAYGLKTANDCPSRNPTEWTISILKPFQEDQEWTVIHEVSEEQGNLIEFDDFWQTRIIPLEEPIEIKAIKLSIMKNDGDERCFQLGQFILYE